MWLLESRKGGAAARMFQSAVDCRWGPLDVPSVEAAGCARRCHGVLSELRD
jgi:hypothetical protein